MLKEIKVVSTTALEWVKVTEMLKLTVKHSFNQCKRIAEEEEGEPSDFNFIIE